MRKVRIAIRLHAKAPRNPVIGDYFFSLPI